MCVWYVVCVCVCVCVWGGGGDGGGDGGGGWLGELSPPYLNPKSALPCV